MNCILVRFLYKFHERPPKISPKWLLRFWRSLNLEPKLLSSRNYRGYVTLWGLSFGSKLGAQIEGRQRAWPKSFMTIGDKIASFFLIFDIYYVTLKIVTYVMSYNRCASLVIFFFRFELIKTHLSSFRLFSAYLGFLIWAHLGLFWAHIGSFWIYLGSFKLIWAYSGPFWAYLYCSELI